MTVLVAYASRHGATIGIAERIAEDLRVAGIDTEARPAAQVHDPGRYDAFVVGSAVYMGHWLKEATSFVRDHREVLADAPVWIFSSGPVGTDLVDKQGRDIFEACRPVETKELRETLLPRDDIVFFGAWDPDLPPANVLERVFRMLPISKELLPAGDFRDWVAVDTWATSIAATLHPVAV